MKRIYLLMITMLLTNIMVFSQPGALDSTFGISGSVSTSTGSLYDYSRIESMAMQSDGKIVAVGPSTHPANSNTFYNDYSDISLTRYNTNGTLDNTFGAGGIVTTVIGFSDTPYDLAIQADGKIVVVGFSNLNVSSNTVSPAYDFFIARYNTNGSLDNSFGTGGIVTTDFEGKSDFATSVVIQADGKILVKGSIEEDTNVSISYTALARYTDNGMLDSSFGIGGKIILSNDDYGSSPEIVIQNDGKIIISRHTVDANNSDIQLVRFNSNGLVDSTFGTFGIATTIMGQIRGGIRSLKIQDDEKIVAAGAAYVNNNNYQDFLLMRFTVNGSLDTTFGIDGFITGDFGSVGASSFSTSIALQPDGKIVLVGSTYAEETFILRYLSEGTLDNTFGIAGKVAIAPDVSFLSSVIQTDGKIVLGGSQVYDSILGYNSFYVARYLSGLNVGILNFSVDNHSMLVYPNPINNQAKLEYTLTQNEVLSAELLDMNGRFVKSFFTNEKKSAGVHTETIVLDESIKTGNYMLVLKNNTQHIPIKIIKQ